MAASCASILAECVPCQTALSAAKADEMLVRLATFGNDVAKLHALAALEQLALNNPRAQERIAQAGGLQLLRGLESFGGGDLRDVAGGFATGLEEPKKNRVAVDAKSHAHMAHVTRLKHSKVWEKAVGIAKAYGKPRESGPEDSLAECITWAEQGECERNPAYMYEACPRSCDAD